jgi:restriction system protein
MPVPDFQTLMLPILGTVARGEIRLNDLIETLAYEFKLTDEERRQLLPSGRQTTLPIVPAGRESTLTKRNL